MDHDNEPAPPEVPSKPNTIEVILPDPQPPVLTYVPQIQISAEPEPIVPRATSSSLYKDAVDEIASSPRHEGHTRSFREHGGTRRARTNDTHASRRSGLDWIVPIDGEEKKSSAPEEYTVGQRLQPTLDKAREEKVKYALKAKVTGYALNTAIGLQVLLGSLTTGLSAVTTGRQTSIMTAILGGLATIVASYLARARGSNEPELSIARTKDLESFIRDCEIFQMDHGHVHGHEYDDALNRLRNRFEELLGNANGERRLAPPV